MNIILSIIIAVLIFYLSFQLANHRENKLKIIKLFPLLISVLWQYFVQYENISVQFGILFILFAAIFLFRYYDKMKDNNSTYIGIIPMGIFLGLLGIIRQDMISYMWGLFFWAMFWAGMADVEGLGLTLLQRAIKGIKQGVFLTAIIILIMLLICIFVPFFSIENIIYGLIKPFNFYSEIIFPNILTLFGLLFYLPIILAVLSLILLIIQNRKRIIRANTPLFWKEMLVINLVLNIFSYSLLGNSFNHLLPANIISSLTLINIFFSLRIEKNYDEHIKK
jgi:hypothetical protein